MGGGGFLNYLTSEAFYLLAGIGVNCFVLISGFFMIERTQMRYKGVMRVWLITAFYPLLGYFIMTIINGDSLSFQVILDYIEPIHSDRYWFVSQYLGLALLAPFLAKGVENLNKREYLTLLLVLFGLFFEVPLGGVYCNGHSLCWFIFLFFLGGYLKRFGVPEIIINNIGKITLAIWLLMLLLFTAANYYLNRDNGLFTLMNVNNNNMRIFLSLSVFVWFMKYPMNERCLSLISKTAPYVFGIYLIHEHPMIKERLWEVVIPDTILMPLALYVLLVTIAIFCICTIIDIVRERLFKVIRVDNLLDIIDRKLKYRYN